MSEEEKPLEFSARDLMPDWAQEKPREPQKDFAKRFAEDDERRDRRGGGGKRGGQRGDDRRGGFGGRGERRDFGNRGGRGERGGPRGEGRGDHRSGPGRGRQDRDPRDRDRRDQPREERPAANVAASIEPSGPAIEGLVRHIRETFRSFPLADLAQMILAARERYRVRFTASAPARLHQCLADGSLWLSREEAISHLLSGPALEAYYTPEDIEVAPPAGSFAVIAVCGMSDVVLGPPNHHEYQRNIARLHRERFSHMPLERYKSRIRMESGEEVLEKWRDQVSRVRQYRVKSAEEPPSDEAADGAESTVPDAQAPAGEAEAASETAAPPDAEAAAESSPSEESAPEPGVETPEETDPAAEGASEAAASEEPAADEASPTESADAAAPVASQPSEPAEDLVLKSMEEVARHFREHFADRAIVETAVAVVPGNVPGRLLSHGLLGHLKQETEKLRRGFPLPLVQALCQEFERHGLRFFKRGKKSLHVAAVRPKALDEGVILTDAIRDIVEFVKNDPKPTVAGLLEALVPGFRKPDGPAIEESAEWSDAARAVLKDLRWLTAEGYLLEFPDTALALGRQRQEAPSPAPASKPDKKGKKAASSESAASSAEAATAPPRETASEESSASLPLDGEGEADPHDPYELPDDVNPVETF